MSALTMASVYASRAASSSVLPLAEQGVALVLDLIAQLRAAVRHRNGPARSAQISLVGCNKSSRPSLCCYDSGTHTHTASLRIIPLQLVQKHTQNYQLSKHPKLLYIRTFPIGIRLLNYEWYLQRPAVICWKWRVRSL